MAVNNGVEQGARKSIVVLMLMVVGVFACAFMYWITLQGATASPDSITYIEIARNLLKGNGFFAFDRVMTHFPPLYPLLLSGVALMTQGDTLLAARVLASFLFGINLVLFCIAVYICTKRSVVATACAVLIFISSAPIISIHTAILSEAPFITFSMAGFIFLAQHLARPNTYWLVMASLMIGLAAATRYIGLVLVPCAVIAIVLLSNRSFKYKIKESVLFVAVALTPILVWFVRNILIAESATNRTFLFHPVGLTHVKSFIAYMYSFVLPLSSISFFMKTIQFGIAIAWIVLSFSILCKKRYIHWHTLSIDITLMLILIIYILLYIAFLILSISFFDANTPTDHRILLPIFLSLSVVSISIFKSLADALNQRLIWCGYVLFILCSVSVNATHAIPMAFNIHHNGSGYTARYWKESDTLAALSKIPVTTTIYSNAPDVIRFLTGRQTDAIPSKGATGTLQENEKYQEQLAQMVNDCKDGRALIVYFNEFSWRTYLPSTQELEAMDRLVVVNRYDDGVIFGVPTSHK